MGILDNIDDTLAAHAAGGSDHDPSVSSDAMRWTPDSAEEAPVPQRPESLLDILLAEGAVVIFTSYTRAEAIADGALIEVPESLAREAGFIYPVAMTATSWSECVEWTEADGDRTGNYFQSETGRLWDVLNATRYGIRRAPRETSQVPVELRCFPRDRRAANPQRVELIAVCGPGDEGEPVITIGFPHED